MQEDNNTAPHTKILLLILAVTTTLAAIFIIFPQIDIKLAGLFYVKGRKFFLDENIFLTYVRHLVETLTVVFIILWVFLIIVAGIKKRAIWGLTKARIVYLMSVLALGPGLLVNTILKDNWGRPRPRHLDIYGGEMHFMPPFYMSDQCHVNCSFVSGDVAIGFYFFALAFAIPRYRKLFIWLGFLPGIIFSATRIMQGGHFLSDTIFSGIFTFTVAYLLYLVLLKFERKVDKF